jgi:hypothetical protein
MDTKDKENKNIRLYLQVRKVPQEARKKIEEGNLKGKTTINPVWRIETLTKMFGPIGQGWNYTVTKIWTEKVDERYSALYVNIDLTWKDPDTGEWSQPVFGTGGTILTKVQNNGKLHLNEDAVKSSVTDAIGYAAKHLGVGADVYFENSTLDAVTSSEQKAAPAPAASPEQRQAAYNGGRTAEGKKEMNELSPMWDKTVTTFANSRLPSDRLRKKMEEHYYISDENYTKLLKQSGRLTDGQRTS